MKYMFIVACLFSFIVMRASFDREIQKDDANKGREILICAQLVCQHKKTEFFR